MNHYTVEFLARDHIADLRREAGGPRIEPVPAEARRPSREPGRAIRIGIRTAFAHVTSQLHLGWRHSPHRG